MNDLISVLAGFFKDLKLRSKWFVIVFILVAIVFGVMEYEHLTGHFYLHKLEQKILLLKELQHLAETGIEANERLSPIYLTTVEELNSFMVSKHFFPSPPKITIGATSIGKAISGSLLWVIVLISVVVSEIQKDKKITGNTIGIAFLILPFVTFFAWLGMKIPTIWDPWVNYLGFPAIQIAVILLIGKYGTKNKKSDSAPKS